MIILDMDSIDKYKPIPKEIMTMILDDTLETPDDHIKATRSKITEIFKEHPEYAKNRGWLKKMFDMAIEYENFGIIQFIIEECTNFNVVKQLNSHYKHYMSLMIRFKNYEMFEYLFNQIMLDKTHISISISSYAHSTGCLLYYFYHRINNSIIKNKFMSYDKLIQIWINIDEIIKLYPSIKQRIYATTLIKLSLNNSCRELFDHLYQTKFKDDILQSCSKEELIQIIKVFLYLMNKYGTYHSKSTKSTKFNTFNTFKWYYEVFIPDIVHKININEIYNNLKLSALLRMCPHYCTRNRRDMEYYMIKIYLFERNQKDFPLDIRFLTHVFSNAIYINIVNDIITIDESIIETNSLMIKDPKKYFKIGAEKGYLPLLKYIIDNYNINP